jgi:hypothetical protein
MPKSARIGIGILALALIGDVAESVGPIVRVTQAFVVVILFGGLLFAIARRRNWARLVFAVCVFGALPFTVTRALRYGAVDPAMLLPIMLTCLQVAGVVCLLLPASNAWFKSPSSVRDS